MELNMIFKMDRMPGKKRVATIEKLISDVFNRLSAQEKNYTLIYSDTWRTKTIEISVVIDDAIAEKAEKLWTNKKELYVVEVDYGEFQRLLKPTYHIDHLKKEVTVTYIVDYKELLIAWARSEFGNKLTSYIFFGDSKRLHSRDYYTVEYAKKELERYINGFQPNEASTDKQEETIHG